MKAADLSPDALARLEAKLVADLEMVRKVRALLEEHASEMAGGSALPPPSPAPAEPKPLGEILSTHQPVRTTDDLLLEALAEIGQTPFSLKDVGDRVRALVGHPLESQTVKLGVARLVRKGKIAVHESRKGRDGCLYRSLLPPTASAENAEDAATDHSDPH